MVQNSQHKAITPEKLSVLALSSRFDGLVGLVGLPPGPHLSVLALSSRFDGLVGLVGLPPGPHLSVLALSSRFDGQCHILDTAVRLYPFSTRSVESF